MAITVISCKEDRDYEQFIRFFIKYRHELTPPYPLDYTLHLISTQISQGHIIMGLDEQGDPVGILTYYYGNPEDHFADRTGLHVEILIIKPEYRKSFAFLQGFQYLINEVKRSGHDVTHIHFYADTESAYLRRLYSKFAKTAAKKEGHLGVLDVYSTTFEAVDAFFRPFRRKK
ncbi:hypothetical protein [Paenibacillus hamazuiensis]|uniref:hypothetical protein n=1 Tax=Paenibacillus hamazuiensis TaxID=2936508 RepID=UPI00200D049A|nr:hypothetical protein [Paenibacillus hamazuiensis]